jgi:integrase
MGADQRVMVRKLARVDRNTALVPVHGEARPSRLCRDRPIEADEVRRFLVSGRRDCRSSRHLKMPGHAELVGVTRGALAQRDGTWWVGVLGKGARRRFVVLPALGLVATRGYFEARGLDFDSAPPATPLLARLDDTTRAPAYTTLAQSLKRLVRRAAADGSLTLAERNTILKTSLHWLRHTHATRAVERQVPPDVLQANLGHADPRTTASYYRARALEKAFGS